MPRRLAGTQEQATTANKRIPVAQGEKGKRLGQKAHMPGLVNSSCIFLCLTFPLTVSVNTVNLNANKEPRLGANSTHVIRTLLCDLEELPWMVWSRMYGDLDGLSLLDEAPPMGTLQRALHEHQVNCREHCGSCAM